MALFVVDDFGKCRKRSCWGRGHWFLCMTSLEVFLGLFNLKLVFYFVGFLFLPTREHSKFSIRRLASEVVSIAFIFELRFKPAVVFLDLSLCAFQMPIVVNCRIPLKFVRISVRKNISACFSSLTSERFSPLRTLVASSSESVCRISLAPLSRISSKVKLR
jgi:hypothetical protein